MVNSKVEVKTDRQAYRTGNVFVETQAFKRGEWVPSGIMASESEWWCFGGPSFAGGLFVVASYVRALVPYYQPEIEQSADPTTPARGVLIPTAELVRVVMTPTEDWTPPDARRL